MRLIAAAAALALGTAWAAEETKIETKSTEIVNLKGDVPAAWQSQKPKTEFRNIQFGVKKVEGDTEDGEFYVAYFRGGSGTLEDNLKRWYGQFKQADGSDTGDAAKVAKSERDGMKIVTVDVPGIYMERVGGPFNPNAKVVEHKGYRLLGAIVDTDHGTYYFRLTGPTKTLEAHRAGFENLIKSLKK